MSVLLNCLAARFTAGTKPLFDGIDCSIVAGDKVGLCGHNGSGKSTLLRLLAGAEQLDGGQIQRRRGLRLAMVEQFLPDALAPLTVLAAVQATAPDGEEYRAAAVLTTLGFPAAEHGHTVADLSGGQQNRLLLARALVSDPEVILFDEPTNHMDLATLQVLEVFLRDEIGCAFVLVSHDRALLDAVTRRTLVLRDRRIYAFDLPFSAARQALAEQDVANATARRAEEKQIEELRVSARRLALWGKVYDNESLAKRAKSMEKRIARMEEDKTFVSAGSGLKLQLETAETRANRALRVTDFDVRAPDGTVLFHINELILRPGDRVALLGANGAGKSTFIRALVAHYRGGAERSAQLAISPQARIGYYDQELQELSGGAPTMASYLRATSDAGEGAIRQALIKAGFAYADHDRAVAVLSGGERARLLFVRLRLAQANFLILDEPTNHIDIDGKEDLEAQLIESGATLLITAHDRRFVDRVADRLLWIRAGRLVELTSAQPFYDWLLAAGSGAGARRAALDAGASAGAGRDQHQGAATAVTLDAVLEHIVELEAKLDADLARKPRHQKPDLQAQWRAQLADLQRRLQAG